MSTSRTSPRRSRGAAFGFIGFAAVMLIVMGVFHAYMGFVALAQGDFYVDTSDYVLELDTTAWGWIHLIAGGVVVLAGYGVLAGQGWARVVGIAVAAVSMLLNFAFIPYYPIWSLLVIAIDVCIIWALADHGSDFPARDTSRSL